MKSVKAFTLIELLIVVAIIAILAAIAVPNFLEAQTRAKVSRAKSDLRAMITGIECYRVENNCYPVDGDDKTPPTADGFDSKTCLKVLTTPVAYITSVFIDPFNTELIVPSGPQDPLAFVCQGQPAYVYIYNTFGSIQGGPLQTAPIISQPANGGKPDNYGLTSLGPNKLYDSATGLYQSASTNPSYPMLGLLYDPTNGTVSAGDIVRTGGNPNTLSVTNN